MGVCASERCVFLAREKRRIRKMKGIGGEGGGGEAMGYSSQGVVELPR